MCVHMHVLRGCEHACVCMRACSFVGSFCFVCAIFFVVPSFSNVETLTQWLAYKSASTVLHLLLKTLFISICSNRSWENSRKAFMHIIQFGGGLGLGLLLKRLI